jgi:hypothetical protein
MQVLTATKYEGKLSKKQEEKLLLASGGVGVLTTSPDCQKKAVALMGWTKELHEQGYRRLAAWLILLSQLNPGCLCEYEVEDDGTLKRLAVVMTYAKNAFPFCFQVLGIDCAHIKPIKYGTVNRVRMLYRKMVITYLTTRTGNNTMLILAVSIGRSENSSDIEWLLHFMIDVEGGIGLDLNKKSIIVMSDRGPCIIAAIAAVLCLAFHMFCGKHLLTSCKHNVKGLTPEHIALYWKAREAVTEDLHNLHMLALKSLNAKGAELFTCLTDKVKGHWLNTRCSVKQQMSELIM